MAHCLNIYIVFCFCLYFLSKVFFIYLQYFTDPVLFSFETLDNKNKNEKNKVTLEEKNSEAVKTFESLKEVDEQEHNER